MSALNRILARLWRIAVIAVRYELNIWRSLGIWVLRLRTVPPGARGHRYAGAVTPLMIVFIVVSAVELPIVHFLLPWETVRLVVDIISVWGLLWMVGLLAAVRVHPHFVDEKGIRVRYAFSVDVRVPWEAVASARSRARTVETGRTVQCEQTAAGAVVSINVMKQTTVDLVLREPTVLDLPQAGGQPVVELRLYADDPAALVADIRDRLAAATAGGADRVPGGPFVGPGPERV